MMCEMQYLNIILLRMQLQWWALITPFFSAHLFWRVLSFLPSRPGRHPLRLTYIFHRVCQHIPLCTDIPGKPSTSLDRAPPEPLIRFDNVTFLVIMQAHGTHTRGHLLIVVRIR